MRLMYILMYTKGITGQLSVCISFLFRLTGIHFPAFYLTISQLIS